MNTSSGAFFSRPIQQGDSLRQESAPAPIPESPITTEGTHLGKKSEYKASYDPSVLVPVPRQENRNTIKVNNDNLPFIGVDVWNAYEVSCLTSTGIPIVGIAKIVYPCESEFLVESKSLKLYLYSFNMTRLTFEDSEACLKELRNTITRDLSVALKTVVKVNIFSTNYLGYQKETSNTSWDFLFNNRVFHDKDSINLDELVDKLDGDKLSYVENPSVLSYTIQDPRTLQSRPPPVVMYSDLLRSNCKITKQPDWGSIFISYSGEKRLVPESVLSYIISFRNENHFHEEICETVYTRIKEAVQPTELLVACFYTRRGGIDINPVRYSHNYLARQLDKYTDVNFISHKFPRQ